MSTATASTSALGNVRVTVRSAASGRVEATQKPVSVFLSLLRSAGV